MKSFAARLIFSELVRKQRADADARREKVSRETSVSLSRKYVQVTDFPAESLALVDDATQQHGRVWPRR